MTLRGEPTEPRLSPHDVEHERPLVKTLDKMRSLSAQLYRHMAVDKKSYQKDQERDERSLLTTCADFYCKHPEGLSQLSVGLRETYANTLMRIHALLIKSHLNYVQGAWPSSRSDLIYVVDEDLKRLFFGSLPPFDQEMLLAD